MNKNQKGFNVIAGLVLLLVVAFIGFAGWYVNNSQNKTNDMGTATSTSKDESSNAADANPKFKMITEDLYSFEAPDGWKKVSDETTAVPGRTVKYESADATEYFMVYINPGRDFSVDQEWKYSVVPDGHLRISAKNEMATAAGGMNAFGDGQYQLLISAADEASATIKGNRYTFLAGNKSTESASSADFDAILTSFKVL